MRDKLMEKVLADYEAFQAAQVEKQRSFRKRKGPYCPRCASPLRKAKPVEERAFYECKRHGFVKHVLN